jgi:large subunit ribosomal protein L9
VADGYARNYLFPRSLGAPVTDETRKRLAKIRREREQKLAEQLDGARQMAARLAELSLTMPVKTGPEDRLYGSVTAGDITTALAAQGVEIDHHKIELEEAIRELGVYDVPVKIHPDVAATVKVWVVEE